MNRTIRVVKRADVPAFCFGMKKEEAPRKDPLPAGVDSKTKPIRGVDTSAIRNRWLRELADTKALQPKVEDLFRPLTERDQEVLDAFADGEVD